MAEIDAAVRTVEAEITYLAPGSFVNRRFVAPGREVNTGRYQPYRVSIRDGRPVTHHFSLDEHGFVLAQHHSSVADFMDKRGYEDALRYLLAREMDLYVVHVLSREEVEPEIVGDLRLIDCEDDDVAEITVSVPLLRRYKETLDAYVGGFRDWCTRRGIAYIFTTNQAPFDKLILNYLRERGLVK